MVSAPRRRQDPGTPRYGGSWVLHHSPPVGLGPPERQGLTSGSTFRLFPVMSARDGGDRRARPVQALRSLARSTLDGIDRILHTGRRRAARRLARRAPDPPDILVVCHGNVCRSPYAEAVLQRAGMLHDHNSVIRSAGFIGPGRPAPEKAVAAADRRGVDLRGHRSKLMTDEWLGRPTLVVVMDTRQRRAVAKRSGRRKSEILVLGDLDPEPIRRRRIEDPWGKPEAVFDRVYARLDRCLAEMARVLNQRSYSDENPTSRAD